MDIKRHTKISTNVLKAIEEIHGGTKVEPDLQENDIFDTAEIEGNIVGYVHARPSISHIFALYVHKEFHQSIRKVGTNLLHECIKSLVECGVNEVQAGVEPNNKKAIEFFEKNSFSISGVGKSGFTSIILKV